MQTHIYRAAEGAVDGKLLLSLASNRDEVREAQRLRYRVFVEEAGLGARLNPERLDADDFDPFCDHLIVREAGTLRVVGTYRLLSPRAARMLGRYYSEGEFDLARLAHLRDTTVEAGRACIDAHYRGGAVLLLLWSGLADYMRAQQCNYLIGCASISLSDGGVNAAAIYAGLGADQCAPAELSVTPHLPLAMRAPAGVKAALPPLLRGYLRSGAWVCGEPAWDPQFDCADLFMLLPLARLEGRYSRRYVRDAASQAAPAAPVALSHGAAGKPDPKSAWNPPAAGVPRP